jgi:hypothetical protein
MATKELIETLAGQRGQNLDAAVTWGDLVDLELVKMEQVPRDIGHHNPPVRKIG